MGKGIKTMDEDKSEYFAASIAEMDSLIAGLEHALGFEHQHFTQYDVIKNASKQAKQIRKGITKGVPRVPYSAGLRQSEQA